MCFDLWEMTVPLEIGGTWHMPIEIGTILIFSLFANNVRTVGPIAMGEALINVLRPLGDDGAS